LLNAKLFTYASGLIADAWITGVDRQRRKVRTTRGSFDYRQLVLAMGASPIPLPLDDASLAQIWRINHYDHYLKFRLALDPPQSMPSQCKKIVIFGAGLIVDRVSGFASTGFSLRPPIVRLKSRSMPMSFTS
jgi:Pyridine nucleotide-disulphide oxidoreductase